MSPFFSIIIPAYNAEKYIEKCVGSLLKQSYADFEIVLIDDGSSDGTARVSRMLEQRDERLHYIHQDNKGVSAARNLGMSVAKGEYLLFVDADDYIKPDTLEKIFERCRDSSIDLCFFGYQYVVDDCMKQDVRPLEYYGKKNPDILLALIEQNTFGLAGNKAIRREFLTQNELAFDRDIKVFEDQDLMMRAWNEAAVICCISESFYYYVSSQTSAMQQFQSVQSSRFFSTHDENLKKLKKFMAQNEINAEQVSKYLLRYVDSVIWNIVRMAGGVARKDFQTFADQLEKSELMKIFRDSYSKAEYRSTKEKLFWIICKPNTVFLMRWLGMAVQNRTSRK